MSFLKDIVARRPLQCDPIFQKQYSFFGKVIELQEDPNGGVGGSLWECSLLILKQLEKESADGSALRGLKTVELGSGTGLISIFLALAGADVVATDRGEAIKLLDHNIAKNTNEGEHRIKRADLSWGEDQEAQPMLAEHKPVDLVVVSECIYNLQYAPHLLKTLLNLCSANTRVLFSFTIRNAVEEQIFFDQKVSEHFVVQQLEHDNCGVSNVQMTLVELRRKPE
eukprot:TRINITY_DN10461_c0_g1_i1.p1 TRINITY_DN10461_c0_g1~~TRINITY_DN10461_c0_g1_i1.p1  ORF type:complete len:240 (-),score=62.04 TRINITY_DN10461_c0_g1_i1:8-682(-)